MTPAQKYNAWVMQILRENGLCIDGGTCHHGCEKNILKPCQRKDRLSCVPLTGSGLTDDWTIPVERLDP